MKESLLENMNLCDLMFIKDAKVEKKHFRKYNRSNIVLLKIETCSSQKYRTFHLK